MLILAVISAFALACVAPWIHRAAGRATGVLLATLPFGLACYFFSACWSAAAHSGDWLGLRESYAWVPELGLALSLRVDGLGLLFALLITVIGGLVLIYAAGYMKAGIRTGRLFSFLLMFMGAMLGLVLADNVLTLYMFWEATSITSFLLIGIQNDRAEARSAAWQALLVTGAGGLAMLAGLLLLAMAGGSSELSVLAGAGDVVRASPLYPAALLLILAGAFTKSAQFPFHFWLPGAMEAPTPVSAYLHSATMVKAGVYLIARLSPAMAGTDLWSWVIMPVGAATMLVGGYLAIHVTDLKRVLAYSTVSALGALVVLLGMGTQAGAIAAVIFLMAHALYKGALFMVAGAVDHEAGTRNLSKLSGLRHHMPVTAVVAGLAALSLAGLGPVLSFIGKELVFEAAWAGGWRWTLVPVAIAASALFVAVAWMVGVRPFWGRARSEFDHVHEPPISLWGGAAILAAGGVVLAFFPTVPSVLASRAASAIAGTPVSFTLVIWHGLNIALGLSALSLAAGAALYYGWVRRGRSSSLMEVLIARGPATWYVAVVAGVNAVAKFQTRVLQNGRLSNYLLTILLAGSALTAWPLLSRVTFRPSAVPTGLRIYEGLLALLMVLAAISAVRSRSRLAAIVSLGVVGYSVGLMFILFGAPDLAMTQFLVETLTVILFVLVFYHLPRYSVMSRPAARARDATIALLGGAVITGLVLMANGVRVDKRLADYFARNSLPMGHGHNIVNVILVDFRGLDTLGEITVLAIAALGVLALLKLRPVTDRHTPLCDPPSGSEADGPAAASEPTLQPPAPQDGGAP